MESTNLVHDLAGRTPNDWFQAASQAFQDLDVERAFGFVQYAIRLDPNEVEYHLLKAKILEMSGGDRRAAIKSYEAALNLQPRNVEVLLRLAQHLQAEGMHVRAAGLIQKAREISPNHKLLKRLDVTPAPAKAAKGNVQVNKSLSGFSQQAKNLFNKIMRRETVVPCRQGVQG